MIKEIYDYTVDIEKAIIYNRFGTPLKHITDSNGNKQIYLRKDIGKRKSYSVPKLIYCLANDLDISQYGSNYVISFKDGDNTNFHYNNLTLDTRSKTMSKKEFKTKLDKDDISNIKVLRDKGIGVKEISKQYRVSISTIYRVLKNS